MMGAKRKSMIIWAASVWAMAALIAGCATLQTGKSDEAVLLERARTYWEARFAQDMARAFSFEDPLRQKKLTLVNYIRMVGEPGQLYGVAVKGVEIQDDQADVKVELNTRMSMPPWDKQLLKNMITDDWQKIEGVWYHVLDLHMIRAGKPRVVMDRGTVEYPSAELPKKESGQPKSTGGAAAVSEPTAPKP